MRRLRTKQRAWRLTFEGGWNYELSNVAAVGPVVKRTSIPLVLTPLAPLCAQEARLRASSPADDELAMRVTARPAHAVAHRDLLRADELEETLHIRRHVAAQYLVNDADTDEKPVGAVIDALDAPRAGVEEAAPQLARFFENERWVRRT